MGGRERDREGRVRVREIERCTVTCGHMNPAPYIRLFASGGSTFSGMRCSVIIMVKLLKNANMNTWKKFMTTNSWKLRSDRIWHVMETTAANERAGWPDALSSPGSVGADDGDEVPEPLLSKRLSLWRPV